MAVLPSHIPGYGRVLPFAGPFVNLGRVTRTARIVHAAKPSADKVLPDLDAAIRACDLRNGAVISFHHHLRNGDSVLNLVLDAVVRAGLKDITVAASALFPVHAPLEIAPELTGQGLPLAKCEAYNRVYDQHVRSS